MSQLPKHLEYMLTSSEITKKRDIEKVSKPYPQYVRIVLRSKDRTSGTFADATFQNINVPERFHGSAVLMVETFNMSNKDSGALNGELVELRIRNIPHCRSFDSSNGGATDLLASFTGYSFQSQSPSVDGVGVPITNLTQLQNTPMTVYLRKTDGSGFAAGQLNNADWVLVLAVIPLDNSVPM